MPIHPAVPATELPEVRSSAYLPPLLARMGDSPCQAPLGDAFGLTGLASTLVTLGPGGQSSPRHWYTEEDDLRSRASFRC